MTSVVVRNPIVGHANWLEYVLRIAAESIDDARSRPGKVSDARSEMR
jgi:hypothetical protein